MELRPHQTLKRAAIHGAWKNGFQNLASVDACGSGKSVVNAVIMEEFDAPSCVIAHRQELVCQLSTALAHSGVYHKIIGPKKLVNLIVKTHMDRVGGCYYDASSPIAVAGVKTLLARQVDLERWAKTVKLWSIDECHHLQRGNEWGRATALFPKTTKGLGHTATLMRGDKRGLGRDNDGLFDIILPGPSARDHINAGYLCDYRVFAPTTTGFNRNRINVGANGEFVKSSVETETRNSDIIGDVVGSYLRWAPGKLGITFMPTIEIAEDTAREYVRRGVPAAVLTGKTPIETRIRILKQFEERTILVLVNVDLVGEGFDLPSLEVVQLARATNSYSLYHQQFMRALRLMIEKALANQWGRFTDQQRLGYIAASEKPYAIIMDHVCNINTEHGGHGLPDTERVYTLDRGDVTQSNIDPDIIPTRRCMNPECNLVYERVHKICPYCQTIHVPQSRGGPEFVDGDITELDELTLARMREEVSDATMTLDDYRVMMRAKRVSHMILTANVNRHAKRLAALEALQKAMEWWAGFQRHKGYAEDESYRRFYFRFGIDVLTAKSLKTKAVFELSTRINEVIVNEFKRMGH